MENSEFMSRQLLKLEQTEVAQSLHKTYVHPNYLSGMEASTCPSACAR